MKKRNWLGADKLANKFRIKRTVQSTLNGEMAKGMTTQQKIIFRGVVIVGTVSLIYAIYYFLQQRAEKKKNAELVKENERANQMLDQKDSYFNEKIRHLQRKVYR